MLGNLIQAKVRVRNSGSQSEPLIVFSRSVATISSARRAALKSARKFSDARKDRTAQRHWRGGINLFSDSSEVTARSGV